MDLEICFQDEYYVAINKPAGLLVHRSRIAADVKEFALQKLRDQLNRKVYLVHRLDRPTSGVLIFAFDKESLGKLNRKFEERTVNKQYWAIVRGYAPEEGFIDHPLKNEDKIQEAQTGFKKLKQAEFDIPVGRYQTSRYSLVELKPISGRMHQLRKHMAHIRHYIVGDRKHGDWRHNKMFEEKLDCPYMLLHCCQIEFQHPISQEEVCIQATIPEYFERIVALLK